MEGEGKKIGVKIFKLIQKNKLKELKSIKLSQMTGTNSSKLKDKR